MAAAGREHRAGRKADALVQRLREKQAGVQQRRAGDGTAQWHITRIGRGLQLLRQPLAARREARAAKLAVTADWARREDQRIEWVRPDPGALCCVRLRAGVFDDAAVARFHAALPHHGVRVARGPWFGEPDRVFRLGFGLQAPASLREALQALSAALDEASAG